jgi:hypothetical protein
MMREVRKEEGLEEVDGVDGCQETGCDMETILMVHGMSGFVHMSRMRARKVVWRVAPNKIQGKYFWLL